MLTPALRAALYALAMVFAVGLGAWGIRALYRYIRRFYWWMRLARGAAHSGRYFTKGFCAPMLKPGETTTVALRMPFEFKPLELVIDESLARNLSVTSIVVGESEMVQADLPGELFVEVMRRRKLEAPGELVHVVAVTFRNNGSSELAPRGWLEGTFPWRR